MVKRLSKIATNVLLAAILNHTSLIAQTNEDFFKAYSNWGLIAQTNLFKKGEVAAIPSEIAAYKNLQHVRVSAGIACALIKKDSWRIKTEIQAQWFGDVEEIFIAEGQTDLPFGYGYTLRATDNLIVYLPISFEYSLFTMDNFNISVLSGFGISYYRYTDLVTSSLGINDDVVFVSNSESSSNPIYASAHTGLNFHIKFKKFLLALGFIYKKSFKSYRTGKVEFRNLLISPDVSVTFNQSGDFFGLATTIYFKKSKK